MLCGPESNLPHLMRIHLIIVGPEIGAIKKL
jgi:hypothetical protein